MHLRERIGSGKNAAHADDWQGAAGMLKYGANQLCRALGKWAAGQTAGLDGVRVAQPSNLFTAVLVAIIPSAERAINMSRI